MLWSTTSKVVFDAETFETVGDPPAPAESSMKAPEQRQATVAGNFKPTLPKPMSARRLVYSAKSSS